VAKPPAIIVDDQGDPKSSQHSRRNDGLWTGRY
jgi:hypothetical protein